MEILSVPRRLTWTPRSGGGPSRLANSECRSGYHRADEAPWVLAVADFFESLGYSAAEWSRLEADLRAQHLPQEATASETTPYGQKYEIALRWSARQSARQVL
jgi:hypothetical protein